MDAGGFLLADPFEVLLRDLSVAYLGAAWHRLTTFLIRHSIVLPDLTWGWLHPGEVQLQAIHTDAPSDFTGWTSSLLATQADLRTLWTNQDESLRSFQQELVQEKPALCLAWTWRSQQWQIAPDDFAHALELIERLWTEEPSYWNPKQVLALPHETHEPRIAVARAIEAGDQRNLDRALSRTRKDYSPLGYRIIVQGFRSYLLHASDHHDVVLPSLEN